MMPNLPNISSMVRIILLLASAWVLPQRSFADTIELTNGEILTGKIIRETSTQVIIQTQFSETITEDRPVPRSQIAKITRKRPDELAFRELEKLKDPDTAFTPEVYEPVLRELRGFLENFSWSSKVGTVRQRLRALEAEQKQIAAGAVKLHGKVVNTEEVGDQAAEIEIHRKVMEINKLARDGDLPASLNEFFVFAGQHADNPAFITAVEHARDHLRAFLGLLEHEMRNHPILEKRRNDQLALASPANQASAKAARERQLEELNASIERSKEAGATIPPYASFSMDSLKSAHVIASQELQKLNEIDTAAMQRSMELLAEAEEFFEQREFTGSEQRVEEALALWPENSTAITFQSNLQAEIERRKESDEHQAQAVAEGFTSSLTPPDATPQPSPDQ